MRFSFVNNKTAGKLKVRYEQLEGRDHVVAPMVMITEGVHNGSQGSVFYPDAELSKNPMTWNHKPVVVYHPGMNSENGSACSQQEINARKVGVILNARHDTATVNEVSVGRLPAESWMDIDRLEAIDKRIMENLETGNPMEVSTGLFSDHQRTPGVWNNEEYSMIATDLQPDHLALLPDKKGACSLADGAGLLINEEQVAKTIGDEGLFPLLQRSVGLTMQHFVANMKSHGNIYSDLSALLRERFENDAWITDVYDTFLVMEHAGKLWRVAYTVDGDDTVSVTSDKPDEVVRVTEYRKVDGSFVGNQSSQEPDKMKTREERVAALVANESTAFADTDTKWLTALEDEQFDTIEKSAVATANDGGDPPQEPDPGKPDDTRPAAQPQTPVADPAVTANQVTAADYIAQAPPEIAAVLNRGMSSLAAHRHNLISTITANTENGLWAEDDLKAMSDGQLEKLAATVNKQASAPGTIDHLADYTPTANYAGAGGGPPQATHNQEALPATNWDE